MTRRLYRSRTDSILGGVAGGVADYLDVDPSLVRIIWAVLAIATGGILLVLYIVMWIVVPEESGGNAAAPSPPDDAMAPDAAPSTGGGEGAAAGTPSTTSAAPAATPSGAAQGAAQGAAAADGQPRRRRRGSGSGALVFGVILIAIGGWFLLRQYWDINLDRLWPIGLVGIGILLLLISIRRPSQ